MSFSDTGESPDKPRVVYLASDSRITWNTVDHRWDSGRKVFAVATAPNLFGFAGDVVLPGLILGQVSAAIEAGILIDPLATADEQHQAVLGAVRRGVATTVATPSLDFTIHHLMRSADWPNTEFRAWKIVYDVTERQCTSSPIAIPATTGLIESFGTGQDAAREHRVKWLLSDTRSATRSQPRSLLSMARLNMARSRSRSWICRRMRMAQTSRSFNGGFWPISLPRFHGLKGPGLAVFGVDATREVMSVAPGLIPSTRYGWGTAKGRTGRGIGPAEKSRHPVPWRRW